VDARGRASRESAASGEPSGACILVRMKLRFLLKTLTTAAGALLIGAVGLLVYAQLTYSNSYLLLPDKPHALAPLVKVPETQKSDKGSLYFVDVIERRATLASRSGPRTSATRSARASTRPR
jgi:hypothetical protein